MKTLLLTLSSLIITLTTLAQGHVFSILANKGTNQIKQGTAWNTAKTGSKIYKGNSLKVSNSGYLGLMHKSGKTVELKTAGEYSISDLESKIQTSTSSYAERYTKFALNIDGSEGAKYNYNVTGSVERGGTYSLLSDDTIKVIKNIPFTMPWITNNSEDDVELRIINLFNDKLYSAKGNGNSTVIDLSKTSIKSTDFYVINLFDPNSEDEEPLMPKSYNLKLIDNQNSIDITNEYNLLTKELNLNSSLDQMVLASFFVEKGLPNYAASHLYQASMISPDVEDYKGAFYQYLDNEGIVTKIK
jgi:hypothetical protein